MPLVVALRSGLYGAAYVHAGNAFHIDDDGILEARLQAKDVRLATDADTGPSGAQQGQAGPDINQQVQRLTIDKLDELPARTLATLRDAGFQFVDELTEESLTSRTTMKEATRVSVLGAVNKLTAPAA